MRHFDAVIFDMDGTLIDSRLDFVAIRAELAIPNDAGILETLARRPTDERTRGERILLDRELTAVRDAAMTDGAEEILQQVRTAGLKTALLTRNAAEAVKLVLRNHPKLAFDLVWSREDGPIKPEPDGVLRACKTLGVEPGRTACVGDFHYDVTAANAAGAVSVLYAPGDRPAWTDEANYVIRHLNELAAILELP